MNYLFYALIISASLNGMESDDSTDGSSINESTPLLPLQTHAAEKSVLIKKIRDWREQHTNEPPDQLFELSNFQAPKNN